MSKTFKNIATDSKRITPYKRERFSLDSYTVDYIESV